MGLKLFEENRSWPENRVKQETRCAIISSQSHYSQHIRLTICSQAILKGTLLGAYTDVFVYPSRMMYETSKLRNCGPISSMSQECNVSVLRFVFAVTLFSCKVEHWDKKTKEKLAAHQPSLPKWVHSWSSCSSTPRSHYPCTPGTHSLQDNSKLLNSDSPPLINH